MRFALFLFAAIITAIVPSAGFAQDRETPYWASLRATEVNMRVGPSEEYRIEWVYRRPQLPVKVMRIKEGWRLVRDPDGAQGWVVARLLSPEQTAIVVGSELAEIHESADAASRLLWKAEPGVVGKLGNCSNEWCQIDIEGRKGWVRQSHLWGAGEP